jgi:regulatory protein
VSEPRERRGREARSHSQRGRASAARVEKSKPAPEPLTQRKLEELALAYLNRFDCTVKKLEQHLRGRLRKLSAPPEALGWVREVVERYRGSGLLDDSRFARNLSAQLGARGKSTRAIAQKLFARGVPSDVAEPLLAERRGQPLAELQAAQAYVRRRRLGPYRNPEQREAHRHKDLATLARQGFSFDVARQALGPGASTDEEF